ncbi:MAG: imidazole glycerol phosphate synthase subunit HisH [Saprospiraceae bacterium]
MYTIIDYGCGNVTSVRRAFRRLGIEAVLSDDPNIILKSKKIILPGVGHFREGMNQLAKRKLIDVLNEAVIEQKIPVLGICLGMQLMTNHSEEGDVQGLGWIDASTKKISTDLRVPHVGWNTVDIAQKSMLLDGINSSDQFYFVHSYAVHCQDKAAIIGLTEYGEVFTSVFSKDNIYATQFHPEKSHDQGLKIIKNFISITSLVNV